MLIEKAKQLKADLDSLQKLEQNAQYTQKFETRLEQLEKSIPILKKSANLYEAFCVQGIAVDVDQKLITALKLRLAEIKAGFDAEPQTILDSSKEMGYAFWFPLKQLPKKVQTALESSWKSHVNNQLPVLEDDILRVLGRIPDLSYQVNRIQKLKREIVQRSRILPTDERIFMELDELIGDLIQSWQNLQGDEIPDNVLAFLKEAGREEGANLSVLSEYVRKWLQEFDLLSSFKIVVSNSVISFSGKSFGGG